MALELVKTASEILSEGKKAQPLPAFDLPAVKATIARMTAGSEDASKELYAEFQKRSGTYDGKEILCQWFMESAYYWREKYRLATGNTEDPTHLDNLGDK